MSLCYLRAWASHPSRIVRNDFTFSFIARLRGNNNNGKYCYSKSRSSTPSISPSPAPPSTELSKDVVIYKYENPRFYKLLNFFAIAQFGFWMVLSYSSMSLIDAPIRNVEDKVVKNEEKEATDLPFWRKINLGEDKYKYGLCASSFLMGYGILFLSWTYILRTVRFLILRKDKKHVAFVTYTPFGQNRIMNVPLKDISAVASRASGDAQMPVKVRNKRLYYLVDLKEGTFIQPKLFDQTVGLQRKF